MEDTHCRYCGIVLDSITCGDEGNLEKEICDECQRERDVT